MILLLLACGGSPPELVPAEVPAPVVTAASTIAPALRGSAAVVAGLRADQLWTRPELADAELVDRLRQADAWPPGMREAPPASAHAAERAHHPVWLELRRPTGEWIAQGGGVIVSGALPTGGEIRATLRGDATTAFVWVYEHGTGERWQPLASVAWEKSVP